MRDTLIRNTIICINYCLERRANPEKFDKVTEIYKETIVLASLSRYNIGI